MYVEEVDLLRTQLHGQGFTVIPDILNASELGEVARGLDGLLAKSAGTRRLLDAPWCSALALRIANDPRMRELLPADARAVQCTFFTKSMENNWLVSFHQDLSIPVAEHVDSANCSGWSQKEGELFVQPPVSVLEETLAVRLHLDDCNERNGALRVVPRSHQFGRFSSKSALLA